MAETGKTYVKNILEAWETNHVKESVVIFEDGGWSGESKKNSDSIDPDQRVKDYKNWSAVQIQTLYSQGMPAIQLKLINELQERTIAQALSMTFKKDEIPFLWIPSIELASVPIFMKMATCGERTGFTSLDPRKIMDLIVTPKGIWYAIFGIRMGKRSDLLVRRRRLTVQETIAVCVYTEALSNNLLIADESRCKGPDSAGMKEMIPYIKLDVAGPELVVSHVDSIADKSGWLSCWSRRL